MQYRSILRQYWGYDDFRGIQRQIIESIGAGRDTLGLMPTGGGKSITFQVPALAMKGLCIVITPLISLMKDQVESLRHHGIKAAFINSSMPHEEVLTTLDNSIFGAYKFLYISPERLSSPIFQDKLQRMKVCFITVDEAHCICQWGYDFRPSYLDIVRIRELLPQCPVLALTATATPDVVDDIQKRLLFRKKNILKMSFERRNLAYMVQREDTMLDGILHALQAIPGSCIIYTRSRRRCRELARDLCEMGLPATFYHAGLDNIQKSERQERWHRGEIRIMVATNAFGMGIDKPDVRLVLHADIPDSIEAYFQEAGRAGRDGKEAFAILITDGKERVRAAQRLAHQFPTIEYVRDVYELLCCFLSIAIGDGMRVTREFDINKFCITFHHYPTMVTSAIDLLEKAGYIKYHNEDDACSRLRIDTTRTELFRTLDPTSERIILSVLRHYGGIFVDYTYIDEDTLSRDTGLPLDIIYQTLRLLAQRQLLSFIPRKHMPHVTFLCRRVDKDEISLSPQIYQDRHKRYTQRLNAMLQYADRDANCCRSRMLLSYFGECATQDCGVCDVCRNRREQNLSEDAYCTLRAHIITQLQQEPAAIGSLDVTGFSNALIEYTIDRMRAAGEIIFDDSLLRIAPKS